MKNNKNNNVKLLVIAIVLTLVVILGTTYAWLRITRSSNTINKIKAGSLEMILDDSASEGIKLVNEVPKSYQQGMKTEEYTFTLTNNGTTTNDYTIYLDDVLTYMNDNSQEVTITEENKLEDSKIRYILLKDGEEASSTKSKLLSSATERIIDTGKIDKNQTISYSLRVWIDSVSSNEVTGKQFNAKLRVEAMQATTKTVTFKTGDYVSMIPTSTSYTVTTAMTGYTTDQTINPSELNLWRVISINSDGTIDLVSEYASSTDIYFRGKTGYQNLVSSLNEIASQYTNSKYTVSSRHMGYNDQTGTITDTSALDKTPAPWITSTSDTTSASDEARGGGDIGYQKDVDLVNIALDTLAANKVGTTTVTSYWLASRYFSVNNYNYSDRWYFNYRFVDSSGRLNYYELYYYFGNFETVNKYNSIRPIITLKSGLTPTGSGTSDSPYILK